MSSSMDSVLVHIRRLSRPRAEASLTDAQLLERFLSRRDEAAFELLVWRYERLVFGVCRRLLRHTQDAEDAFQATFLALSRQAASLADRQSLAGWLYRVAYRAALAARVARSRHARHEGSAVLDAVADERQVPADPDREELGRLLDEEVMRLPERYRTAVVLYYFYGKSYTEAARELDCPRGTLSIRLTRARALLRRRLARRGVTLPAGAAAVWLTREAAAASAALVRATVRAVLLAPAAAAAAAPALARVTALAEAALRTTGKTRRLLAMLFLLAVGAGLALAFGLQPASSALPGAGSAPAQQVAPPGREQRAQRPAEKDRIAWGTAVNGLQAGLGYAFPRRSYRVGEKVEFVFQLRNASDRPLSFTYAWPMFVYGGNPTVSDAKGKVLGLEIPALNRPVQLKRVTLAPGKSVELGRPSILLQPPGPSYLAPQTILFALPGRYKVSQRIGLETHTAGDWVGEVVTESLELDVLPPAPAGGPEPGDEQPPVGKPSANAGAPQGGKSAPQSLPAR